MTMEVEDTPSDSQATAQDDAEAILVQLKSLSKALDENPQNNDNITLLNDQTRQLYDAFPVQAILQILVPYLFVPPGQTQHEHALSNAQALVVLGYMVSQQQDNVDACLKPAARTLRQVSEQWNPAVDMHVSPELTQVLVDQVSSSNVQVSADASATLVACCCAKATTTAIVESVLSILVNVAWKPAWQQLQSSSSSNSETSTLCVRYASLTVDLLQHVPTTTVWTAAHQTGALSLVVDMLQAKDDSLLQMSVLDLVERLATSETMSKEQRAQWLCSKDVLEPLLVMAGGGDGDEQEENEPDPILGGPALRVLAALCQSAGSSSSSALVLQPSFSRALQTFVRQSRKSNELDRLAVVDAISSFAIVSTEALDRVLHQTPEIRNAWLSLDVAQSKLKAAIVGSITRVLRHDYASTGNNDNDASETLKKKHQLYGAIARVNRERDTTDFVFGSLIKSPFPEVRLAAYALWTALIQHTSTGAQLLLQNAQFFPFLLSGGGGEGQNATDGHSGGSDSSSSPHLEERTKEGREAKHEMLVAIYNSPAKGLLADAVVQQMERRIQQGPHYVPTRTWELATEE